MTCKAHGGSLGSTFCRECDLELISAARSETGTQQDQRAAAATALGGEEAVADGRHRSGMQTAAHPTPNMEEIWMLEAQARAIQCEELLEKAQGENAELREKLATSKDETAISASFHRTYKKRAETAERQLAEALRRERDLQEQWAENAPAAEYKRQLAEAQQWADAAQFAAERISEYSGNEACAVFVSNAMLAAPAPAEPTPMAKLNNALFVEQWERLCLILGVEPRSVIDVVNEVERRLTALKENGNG